MPDLENYIPMYIPQTVATTSGKIVTANRWNELFNLLIEQGNYNAETINLLVNGLEDIIILEHNITTVVTEETILTVNQIFAEVAVFNTTVTETLYADTGYIAALTVDELDTSDKIKNYKMEPPNADDVNYIKIYDQHIEFIEAITDGTSTEPATNRDGTPLYWLDETKIGITTTVTDYPVIQFVYTELRKMKMAFEDIEGLYTPVIELGAGTIPGQNNAKGFIYKGLNGMLLKYYDTNGTDVHEILLGDGGIEIGGYPYIPVVMSETEPEDTNVLWIDTSE